MKRGTIEHPKTLRLSSILGLEKWGAVGILECLWHFTSRYAPQGNVGKFSDQVIADSLGWKKDPKILISALIECEFVEIENVHRLIVHDWSHHADDAVNKYLRRRKLRFADGLKPFAKVATKARPGHARGTPGARPVCDQPEPLPLPLPLPTPEPTPEPTPHTRVRGTPGARPGHDQGTRQKFDTFWTEYPRKDAKQIAFKSFQKLNPDDELFGKIIAHVESMNTSEGWTREDGRYIPMPATYLNQQRWQDQGVVQPTREIREAAENARLVKLKDENDRKRGVTC